MNKPDLNLDIENLPLEKVLLESILPCESVGINSQSYKQLLQEAIMPRPDCLTDKTNLTVSECTWLIIARELQDSGYSNNHICRFKDILMTRIDYFREDAEMLEPDVLYTSYELAPRVLFSCYVLDIYIGSLLTDKKDIEIQFNRQGKFKIITFNDFDSDEKALEGPILSFSLSQVLSKILGKSNVPAINNLYTQITTAEAEVLKTLRVPEYLTVSVEKAPPGSNYTWDVIGRQIGQIGVGAAKGTCENVARSYDKFVLNGQNSREMPFEFFRRKRCW